MDDKGIGRDIIIGIVGNIIWAVLALVGTIIYKNFKKQTLEVRYSIIGTSIGVAFTTFSFFTILFLNLIANSSSPFWTSVLYTAFPLMIFKEISENFFRKRFGNKTEQIVAPINILCILGQVVLLIGVVRSIILWY